jgi:hypothetical protein
MAALELDRRAIPPDPLPAIIPPGLRQEQFATEPDLAYDISSVTFQKNLRRNLTPFKDR